MISENAPCLAPFSITAEATMKPWGAKYHRGSGRIRVAEHRLLIGLSGTGLNGKPGSYSFGTDLH